MNIEIKEVYMNNIQRDKLKVNGGRKLEIYCGIKKILTDKKSKLII